jgi:hypothetical protein
MVIRGDASAVTATSVRVGDLEIPLAADTVVQVPKTGGRVFISGRMINGQFTPQVISGGAALPFGDGVSDVSLEAYAPSNAGGAQSLSIHGVDVTGAALPAGTVANDHILITGKIDGSNTIAASTIAKVRTVVTVLAAQGSLRPAAIRPDISRPDRVRPPDRPERPQGRPEPPAKPDFERPTA